MTDTKLSNQELIALMDVYLNEFIFRSNQAWSQLFKLYFAIIVVILLPYISGLLNIDFTTFPKTIFHIIGFVLLFPFSYVGLSRLTRVNASADTYNKMIDKLPVEYQRDKIKRFRKRNTYILFTIMFITLIALNALFLFFVTIK